jgi:hypothetical protein
MPYRPSLCYQKSLTIKPFFMRGKYINQSTEMAYLSAGAQQDIHQQLNETIAEHKRIMKKFLGKFFEKKNTEVTALYSEQGSAERTVLKTWLIFPNPHAA